MSVKFRHVACVMVRYLVACVCYLDLQVSSVQCCTELLCFLSVSKQQSIIYICINNYTSFSVGYDRFIIFNFSNSVL